MGGHDDPSMVVILRVVLGVTLASALLGVVAVAPRARRRPATRWPETRRPATRVRGGDARPLAVSVETGADDPYPAGLQLLATDARRGTPVRPSTQRSAA